MDSDTIQIQIRNTTSFADPDPESGAFFRDGKNPDLGSRMNISDNFSESLETIFRVHNIIFFDANLGSGIILTVDPESRMANFGSRICDPQH